MSELPDGYWDIAVSLEEHTYYPEGREIDGCPYSHNLYDEQLEYYHLLRDFLGGYLYIRHLVLERKVNEPLANETCANWQLWTVLNELGVSRVRE